ncbi:acyltransferase family protein [Albimonas pacifica]|uniref:Peptidoglycan/LPS O-acetylase OafA/YrhL, contains acyltransferase and SGNH-hydrolase domains n=1 Tax=Albimonas pacifica TaxID=1114924 RepID=A0A1I3PRR3_9RHOB|nr:acyltransferase family protein [Albimonas pacifica]SFJ24072.1 Peptidoglycan/LPS O-acetylase OafA/YrhL, contains acyltransferase and SGNH-hydrolase domains [Albimonas pacifica]
MRHRPHVDGLRALAVVPVVAFHLGSPLAPGGYVGVDVFFVISGYLITAILLEDLDRGRWSPLDFYKRRILRILPALSAVLLAVFVLSGLLFLPSERAAAGVSIAAAAGFLANLHFWSGTGYFSAPAETQPLLHVWSLAVEEQFYIVFPPLLFLMATHARRHLARLLAGLCALSFAACVVLTWLHPPTAFYLPPARAWELGAGALLAVMQRGGSGAGLLPRRPPSLRPSLRPGAPSGAGGAGPAALALLGLALVAAPMALLDRDSAFPGWVAAAPALGATLLIGWGAAGPAGRLLSWGPLVALGQVSYGLYLWHWPLIVFWKAHAGPQLSGREALALGLASLALGALSTRLVERPFRTPRARRQPAGRVAALGGLTLAALAGLGGLAAQNLVPLRAFPEEVMRIAATIDYRERPEYDAQFRSGRCLIGKAEASFAAFDADDCARPVPGAYNVLLIGDSHAAQFWGPLVEAFPEANVMQATSAGCRVLLGLPRATRCAGLRAWLFERFLPETKVDRVLIGGRWMAEEMAYVPETLERLQSLAGSVAVIGPTVEYLGPFPSLLARSRLRGEPFDDRAHRVPGRDAVDAQMKAAAEAAGATYIDVLEVECGAGACRLFAPDGEPMQFDYGHLTFSGARAVVEARREAFIPAAALAAPDGSGPARP